MSVMRLHCAPDEVFTKANAKLCEGNDAGMFVTAWMAYVNVVTGEVTFANAGHNPPLIRRAGGEFEYLRSRPGFVLAGMEDVRYRSETLSFEPGDEIFLYTDGITEATNAENELYGEKRLISLLSSLGETDAKATCSAVKNDVDAFACEAPQFDDMTMLSLKLQKKETMKKNYNTDSSLENVTAVTEFINELLEEAECSMKAQMQIDVAVDEIFSNISKFAYSGGIGPVSVTAETDKDKGLATICFIDSGTPYNPLLAEDPDITLSAEERGIGGLGIYLVKKTMNDVQYEYKDGQNILTIIKNIA